MRWWWATNKDMWIGLICIAVMALSIVPYSAYAQDDDGTTKQENREAAAAAYDRGTKAYVAGDYARAARFYETAFRLAPAAPALIQAVKAYQQAGDDRRAGTAALALQEEYGVSQMAEHTTQALEKARAQYFRVDIVCENCKLEIEGERQEFLSVFLEPDKTHTITAVFESGPTSKSVKGAAGEQKMVALIAPRPGEGDVTVTEKEPEANANEKASEASREDSKTTSAETSGSEGLSPVFFWTGVGLTAVVTGVTIWSGLDTQSAADTYEKNPTQKGLDDGRSLELRTDILIGVSAALAVGTAVVGIFFTDWNGSEAKSSQTAARSPQFRVAATWVPGGGVAMVRGQF